MSKPTFVLCLFLLTAALTYAQNYVGFFSNEACRVDFYLTGNSKQTEANLYRINREPQWGGRKTRLTDDMNLGEYRFHILDSASNQLIYTDGFSTLFYEWQTTPEALHTSKGFEQSIQFPFPLHTVKVDIEKRLSFSTWQTLNSFYVNPTDKLIRRTTAETSTVKTLYRQADPAHAIDIAVVAEGYTAKQQKKFFKDAQRLAESLLAHAPFDRYKSRINIHAIATVSADTGVSAPHKNYWVNTALGAHFYTFYSDRYLTSPLVFKLHDYASQVPYDALYILANTKTYGGGGIFNFYTLASSDSKKAQAEVVVHEFGHSFAGLGDEYFYDNDALDQMYDLKDEPWEPNISTLIHFDAKWKKDLPAGTLIPTPVTDETKEKMGVFEGGGYMKKGIFRPYFDCRMRTNAAKSFCPVCEKAVIDRILFLTE